MTWGNRFRLFFGLVLVLAIVAAATLVFNQRQTHVVSSSAEIGADLFDVGTDYGGIVLDAFVAKGDVVTEGQQMFVVRNLQLAHEQQLRDESVGATTTPSDGTVIVRAATRGTVSDVAIGEGSFAGPGAVLATLEGAGSLYAQAEFILSPRDFERIDSDAAVTLTLPDGSDIEGTVTDITVETTDGDAHVTVRVDTDALAAPSDDPLLKPGTPLEASLELRADGPLARVHDALSDLAKKIGL